MYVCYMLFDKYSTLNKRMCIGRQTRNRSEGRRPQVAMCTASDRMSISVGNGLRMRRCLRFRQSVRVATRSAVTLSTIECHSPSNTGTLFISTTYRCMDRLVKVYNKLLRILQNKPMKLCTCIISLNCKGGQHGWVFVPFWQPVSDFLYACAYCVLRRINMMTMMMGERK